MSKNVSDRVSTAIKDTPLSDDQIGKKVGVSATTVWRWANKKTKRFSERDLKALAKTIHVSYEWLQFGKGQMYEDDRLNQIGSAVNDAGESYKGLDRTLSGVESKAKSLIQDLQSLIHGIDDLKNKR